MLTTESAARMCPRCGESSRVYDSREREDGVIVRKRRCVKCGTEYETNEFFVRVYPVRV